MMVALGYVEADQGNQVAQVAQNMRYLVAGLYFFTALIQLLALKFVYNLDKETVGVMEKELREKRSGEKAA